ncbi:MAG: family 78 glycoside hydrolase catalytic domain [Clostridia bacterium]|nr:family 78 glycoside hydrolase catalytic domain [Clostridia bacterium]
MEHSFKGKWITDSEFSSLPPRNVFFRQLERINLPCNEHRNRHILFRKKFNCTAVSNDATVYISADDYYKLYINGSFVAQGPTPAYHSRYNYNVINVSKFLRSGENVIAVHTLYQGLINRVWQSGDNRHGLILDLECGGETVVASDESFKTIPHSGYTELGFTGYHTQFLERYDSNSPEVGFEAPDFDDGAWNSAEINRYSDHVLNRQTSKMPVFETIPVASSAATDNGFLYDFGSNYVGYLRVTARGKKGDVIGIRCAQELNDGSPRYKLRANCCYNEEWVLSDGECTLDWFDYKSFRYAELSLPEGVEILDVSFLSKHYPFELKAAMNPEFESDPEGKRIWELCVHSLEYGVQEVIQDCMEREKGFYLGDGCYTALAHMVLTKDDSMVRRLIDDAFASEFITDTLMTCMNCSFMQEIAEYPLILALLLLWHYRFTDDREYLATNLKRITKVLDGYRRDYEKDGLLRDVNKFCVVEWPQNFRHGYDVDIVEGKVCHEAHVSLSSYYLAAINTVNKIAAILGQPEYRNIAPLIETFNKAFFNPEKHLFKDGENTEHICLVGNSFVYGFGLCDDPVFDANFMSMLKEKGIDSLSFFCTFPVFMGLVRDGRFDTLRECILHEGTWKRMLREGATTTFEGWGKDTKWNTSLFHLTMSYAAIFMADIDLQKLFG